MTLYDYQIDSLVIHITGAQGYITIRGGYQSRPDKMPRSEKEKMFREEFLGKVIMQHRCTIENMEDIILVYNDRNNSLAAFCDKPIIIQNNALKYRINYFLDQFTSSEDSAFMSGTFYFSEIPYPHTKVSCRSEKEYLPRFTYAFYQVIMGKPAERRRIYNEYCGFR